MRRILAILTLTLLLAPAAVPALAQPATSTSPTQQGKTVVLKDPLNLGTGGIPKLINNIIKAAVGVVGAFALLVFVYGGFLLLTSSGEAAKIQAGKDAMKWAAIGVAVVFSSYALVSFVLQALT